MSIQNIGGNIARMRKAKGATQEDLAREINLRGMEMTPLIISRIEKNQRHVVDGELKMLAEVLGVTMEWLCSDDD